MNFQSHKSSLLNLLYAEPIFSLDMKLMSDKKNWYFQ